MTATVTRTGTVRADGAVRSDITFDDNARLVAVFGAFNRNLARMEQWLDARITNRANEVRVVGSAQAVKTIETALRRLYVEAGQGREIGLPEVDAAIRDAERRATPAMTDAGAAPPEIQTRNRIVRPRSPAQERYVAALREFPLVFGCGPAGTGKTYLAVAMAVSSLLSNEVRRIVLSRPAVEAGERLGFLPGDLKEKIDPYLRPLYDALHDMMPVEQVNRRIEHGDIEIAPLAFMRGRTLSRAFVILDEAQNATPMQMKMFLTRLGEGSRMAVTGDPSQTDLPAGTRGGLVDALAVLEGVAGVGAVRLSDADVVRHDLVTRIVRAYSERNARQRRGPAALSGAEWDSTESRH